MKIRILPLLALLVVGSNMSCKKNSPTITSVSVGFYITGSKNNVSWSGSVQANHQDIDTLLILGGGHDELLGFKLKFTGIGNYPIVKNQGFYWLTVGEDVITSEYNIRPDTLSSVSITSYDHNSKIIEGSFNLKLAEIYPIVNNLTRNSFTNGKFRVRIQ